MTPDEIPLENLHEWQAAVVEWQKSMVVWRNDVTKIVLKSRAQLRLIGVVVVVMLVILAAAGVINEIRQSHRDHAATQQSVSARYEACQGGNKLRTALRQDVIDGQKQAPLLYKLFPQLNTPEIRKLSKQSAAKKLEAYADLSCKTVALAILPSGERGNYNVP